MEIRLKCDELGCREWLTVQVEDEYGPWRGSDRAALEAAAGVAGWSVAIEWDGMAFIHCPAHQRVEA